MGLIRSFAWSFKTIGRSFKLIKDFPVFFYPVLFSVTLKGFFAIHMLDYLYKAYPNGGADTTLSGILSLLFLILFVFSLIEGITASLVFEIIEHLKKKEKPSLIKAIIDSISFNFIRMLPLIVMWTLIRFIFAIIDAIISALTSDKDGNQSYTGKAISKGLEAILDIIKLSVMLMYPAIAWEGKGSWSALKKGARYARTELGKIVSGKLTLDLMEFIIYLPSCIFLYLYVKITGDSNFEHFGYFGWTGIIAYTVLAKSIYEFVEILYVAELYTWASTYETEKSLAITENRKIPNFRNVERPNIIGIVREL